MGGVVAVHFSGWTGRPSVLCGEDWKRYRLSVDRRCIWNRLVGGPDYDRLWELYRRFGGSIKVMKTKESIRRVTLPFAATSLLKIFISQLARGTIRHFKAAV